MPEDTFGTYDDTNTPVWIRLTGDNAFTMRKVPLFGTLNSADAGNVPVQKWTNRYQCVGTLSTPLYHAQADALLNWAIPTGSPKALPSYTCDYYDGVEYHRFLGVRPQALQIASSTDNNGGEVRLQFQLIGQKTATITGTDLPAPSFSNFPTGLPYYFQESSTGFKISSTATMYNAFNVSIQNMLDVLGNELAYPDDLRYCGRRVTWSTNVVHVSNARRSTFTGCAAIDCELLLTKGGNSVKFDFHATNYMDSLGDNVPLGAVNRQALAFTAYFSGGGTNSDFTITIA